MARGGKRDPITHRTPVQEKEHIRGYQATTAQKKNRAARNAARATMAKAGVVKKGDGKDVDHKRPLMEGGTNARSNLRTRSPKKNRASAKKGRRYS